MYKQRHINKNPIVIATLLLLLVIAILIWRLIPPSFENDHQITSLSTESKLIHKSPTKTELHSKALMELYTENEYGWPPTSSIPAIYIEHLPEDMNTLSIEDKKRLFFQTLLPLVIKENKLIDNERTRLLDHIKLGQLEQIARIAENYGITCELNNDEIKHELLSRIDKLPVALVLAQAANESAWGTSRFTREANNLFGEWTYKENEGIVPGKKRAGSKHFIRRFSTLQASIRSYLNNINRGHAYVELRQLRAKMRSQNQPVDAFKLAEKLTRYSQLGNKYVLEIQSIIRQNRLERLNIPTDMKDPI